MNPEQAYELLNSIKNYEGQQITVTYYKKISKYQIVDGKWKIKFGGYEKITENVNLCEINSFGSILIENKDTKMTLPFFGRDCIIESISSTNTNHSELIIYRNPFLNNDILNIEMDNLGEEIKKKMFLSDDIEEQIKEIAEREKQSKSADNPLLNDLFDKPSVFDYGTRDRIFPFTNEMLNLYMPAFSFTGKRILANLGGGDFSLNAYLLGAKNIDTFDINEYSYYYYELKKALIKFCDYDEFLGIIENPIKIYKNFDAYKHLLKPEVAEVIHDMFQKYSGCLVGFAKKLFLPAQFNASEKTFSDTDFRNLRMTAQFRNFYLSSEENYNTLRSYLLNGLDIESQFFLGDVTKLQFASRYDLIYLSNIGDNIDPKQYSNFLFFLQNNILTDDGQIIIVDKANKFEFLAESDYVSKVEYDASQISNYNANNMGVSSIPDSEIRVSLYSLNKQPKEEHKR